MGLSAAIMAGASVLGAGVSAYGANQAANTQANAAKSAQQTELQMYDQTRSDLSPYRTGGASALDQLLGIYGLGPGGALNSQQLQGMLTNTPGYQFGLNQGVQALDRSAASRGMLLSGAQLKDAQQWGQGYAMQNAWQPYVQGLQSLSGMGENAAAQTGTFGQNTANQVSQLQLAQGQAQAAGSMGIANSLTGALNNSAFLYSLYGGGGMGGANGSTSTGQFEGQVPSAWLSGNFGP